MERSLAAVERPDSEEKANGRLLDDLNQLCAELDCDAFAEEAREAIPFEGWPPMSMPSRGDQELLAGLRAALAKVAAAHGLNGRQDVGAIRAVRAALDGAQLTARTEVLVGDREQLRRLVPSFVYLVVLPLGEEAAAHRAAEQAARALESSA